MNQSKAHATILIYLAIGTSTSLAGPEAQACDPERGRQVAQKCIACHTLDAGGDHGAGPNLYRLQGRQVGQTDGFRFSSSLRKSGDTWSTELLDAFLASPNQVYPGTRMAFAGLRKPEDRSDLICYLDEIWQNGEP